MLPYNDLSYGPWYDERRQLFLESVRDDLPDDIIRETRHLLPPYSLFSSDVFIPAQIHYIEKYFSYKSKWERDNIFHPAMHHFYTPYQMKEHLLFTIRRVSLTMCVIPPPAGLFAYAQTHNVKDPAEYFSESLNYWHFALGIPQPATPFAELVNIARAAKRDRLPAWQPFLSLTMRECHISYSMLLHSIDLLIHKYGLCSKKHLISLNYYLTVMATQFKKGDLYKVKDEFAVPWVSIEYHKDGMDINNIPPGVQFFTTSKKKKGPLVDGLLVDEIDMENFDDQADVDEPDFLAMYHGPEVDTRRVINGEVGSHEAVDEEVDEEGVASHQAGQEEADDDQASLDVNVGR